MSDFIFPLQEWPEGIAQASVPANENSLRNEALRRPCLGTSNNVASPNDGDLYIVGISPTGSFSTFSTNDLAFARVTVTGVSWHAWAPTDGLRIWMEDGSEKVYVGESTNQWQDAGGGGGGGTDLGWFNILDYREGGDPDDTNAFQLVIDAAAAAGGGAVYFPPQQGTGASGKYIIGGALQDTGAANAQIVLPSIDILTGDQITIELRGGFPPTPDISVIGDIPVSVSGSVIESTLTTGSGGSLIGIKGPPGSAGDFSNVLVVIRDLTIRMPDNPTHSAVDLRYAACAELDNVVIDTGSYYIQGLPEPTTSGSYALRMPRQNNGALCRLGTVNVIGFYNGYEFAEHSNGFACQAAWGCKRAFVFNTAPYHGSHFQRLMAVHCERVLVGVGDHFLQVEQLNIEHAASGWWVTDFDVDDASNYLVGSISGWQVVLAGSGVDSTFTVAGAAKLNITRLGWENRLETVSVSSDITFAGVHANKRILHPSADTTARVWTIPSNASVPYPIGTTLAFGNQNGAGVLTIAITSDTMYLAGSGSTGSRTLAANGSAVAVKETATVWQISGVGLT